MNIKRRGLLTAGGSVAAALSLSALANHLDHDVVPRLAIVDSRIPGAGAAFEEHGSLWVDLAALSAYVGVPCLSADRSGEGDAAALPLALAPNRMTAHLQTDASSCLALLERPATRQFLLNLLLDLP